MAKDFKSKSPLNNFTTIPAEHSGSEREPESVKTVPVKRRVGRPTTKKVKETCRKINVAIPIELLDKWDEVKKALGGNQTAYIVNLIRKDLNENYASYKELAKKQEELGL